jgi:hypothetical protein
VKRRGRALLTLALFAALGVAGCGTVSAGPPIPPPPAADAPPDAPSAVPAALTSGRSRVAGKSPLQIMRASAQALDGVHSFQIDAHGVDTDGRKVALTGVFVVSTGPDKALSLTVADGSSQANFRVVAGYAYIAGNAQFWTSSRMSAQEAQQLAGHWLRVPTARLPGFASLRDWLNPAKVGRCILGTDGVVATSGGRAQVNGGPAVVLKAGGPETGGPVTIYVSARGAPLPLLVTQTGAQSTTTMPDHACGDTVNSSQGAFGATKRMTMTFGHWNQASTIAPPPGQFTSLSGDSTT